MGQKLHNRVEIWKKQLLDFGKRNRLINFLEGKRNNGGSRNLVGIAIQLSDSEEEEFFVGYSMLISPEKFDFGVE